MKMILWSICTFWYKGLAENKEKLQVREKGPSSQKWQQRLKGCISPEGYKNKKIDNSQMHCKCYTRYKSNPIYTICSINGKIKNPPVTGNSDFSYFRRNSVYFTRIRSQSGKWAGHASSQMFFSSLGHRGGRIFNIIGHAFNIHLQIPHKNYQILQGSLFNILICTYT